MDFNTRYSMAGWCLCGAANTPPPDGVSILGGRGNRFYVVHLWVEDILTCFIHALVNNKHTDCISPASKILYMRKTYSLPYRRNHAFGMGGIILAKTGFNSSTDSAVTHSLIPGFHTKLLGESCPAVAICDKVARSKGPAACPLMAT